MPDNTLSTLEQIRIKVRRLTRSLSESQLSDSELDNYINTFVLYDFPEHLRLFNLKETLTFFAEPYIDTYSTNTTDPSNPLYNFKNKYISVNPPAYIAGYQALWTQSRDQFYGIYPNLNSIQSIGFAGDGSTTTFTGNINTNFPNIQSSNQGSLILQNNVLFDSIDANGASLALIDYPATSVIGYLGIPGTPATSISNNGQINYLTGNFTITFPNPPASGAPINSQTVLVQPSIPQTILFYDGAFVLRPVPDQAYRITVEVFARPTELLVASDEPKLSEWFQYISYGAAIKIFQDRMDLESVQQVMPEFRNQMNLINRRTIVQQTNQRTATIYTEQTGGAGLYGGGWFAGGSLM